MEVSGVVVKGEDKENGGGGQGVLEDIKRGYNVKDAVKRKAGMTVSEVADDVKRYTGMRGE